MDAVRSMLDPDDAPMPMSRDEAMRKAVPLDMPLIASRHLALANRLSVRRRPVSFRVGETILAFSPLGLGRIDAESDAVEQVAIDLQLDGQPATLRLPSTLYERIIEQIDPVLQTADLEDEMLPLLLEAVFGDALTAAETQYRGRVELLMLRRDSPHQRRGLEMLFEVALNRKLAGKVYLGLDETSAGRLADALETRTRTPVRYGRLNTELSFRGGVMWLTLGELRSLKTGDILLADDDVAKGEGIAATLGETWLLNADFNEAGLMLTRPLRPATKKDQDLWMMVDEKNREDDNEPLYDPLEDGQEGQRAPTRQQRPPQPAQGKPAPEARASVEPASQDAAGFDEVPIKLVFELGRQEISLGALQALGPGHVFQLDRPIGDAVEVFAGGRRIGQGEIVRIDEQVGVRMTRLFGHG